MMTKALQDKLKRKYVHLMERSLAGTTPSPFRLDGFAVGDGWYKLVDTALSVLAEFPTTRIDQIKEKFGGLRIYFAGNISDRARDIIDRLEKLSFTTCEVCGEYGETRSLNYWTRTVCDKHLKEWETKNEH